MSARIITRTFMIFLLAATIARADEASVKKEALRKAEEYREAVLEDNFEAAADLTYAKLIELSGGREKYIKTIKATKAEMKSQGMKIDFMEVMDPGKPQQTETAIYILVPYQTEMTASVGTMVVKSHLLGVKSRSSKKWSFLDTGTDEEQLRKLLPDLPEKFKIPKSENPVLRKS